MSRKSQSLASPKVLTFGKLKIFLVFLSLNRALASPKVLTFGKPKIFFGFSLT